MITDAQEMTSHVYKVPTQATTINKRFQHHVLNSIMLLNELGLKYPNAISFGSGRPHDLFCEPEKLIDLLPLFKQYLLQNNSVVTFDNLLGQYGPSAGIIRQIVAEHLRVDEGIIAAPEDIVITLGCQEAIELCTKVLFDDNDVLMMPDPIFIGMTGSAIINNVNIWPFDWSGEQFDLDFFEKEVAAIRKNKKIPKAIYLIPDFNNPYGTQLALGCRVKLLAFAKKENIIIVEDAAYRFFDYHHTARLPSLKALEPDNVIYLGSAAKTVYPGLRIGYLVAGQRALIGEKSFALAQVFAQAKSFMSVNTPPIDQAIFAGLLLKYNYSLKEYCKPQVDFNKNNLSIMLEALEKSFPSLTYPKITWNKPRGGYFVLIKLPFYFGYDEMEECAKAYNIIVTPLSLLSISDKPRMEVRLSFTNVSPEKIREGIKRFASFVLHSLHS